MPVQPRKIQLPRNQKEYHTHRPKTPITPGLALLVT
jgi:hypothetical protein